MSRQADPGHSRDSGTHTDPMRTVAIFAFDGNQMLDVTGPAEVFDVADRLAGGGRYAVRIASADGTGCVSSSGLRFEVDCAVADLPPDTDAFVVPGTYDWRASFALPGVADALRTGAARSRRVAGICAGAFLLGPIGLLDGRRCTTHWMFYDDLARAFPAAIVERGPIFVEDGPVITSAGVSAGIDLALAMVEADLGAELAREVARFLVIFMQRPGGQDQFSVRLRTDPGTPEPLRRLLDVIVAEPAADHRLAALSARAGFSERHLTRLFATRLGTTPAAYVEEVRIEYARQLLEASELPLAGVAKQSGLGSAETLRRAFTRSLGVSPNTYRQRFRTTGVRS